MTPETKDIKKLNFGSGGGFTGLFTEYCLVENGTLYKKIGLDTEWEVVQKIKKDQAQQILKQSVQLDLASYKLNMPGNKYKYLLIDNDGVTNRITWGQPGQKPKKEVELLYNILNNLVKAKQ